MALKKKKKVDEVEITASVVEGENLVKSTRNEEVDIPTDNIIEDPDG